MSASRTADRASEALARELRRELAKRSLTFFVTYYFRTDEGASFDLRPFHVELLDTAQNESDIPRALFLEPASFGKSTHLAKHYAIWSFCVDPNVRIALGGKTFEDAVKRLRSIKTELETNKLLMEDFGPFVGDVWKEDQINVKARTVVANESTITCFGSETNVFGWRADKVILDDIVTIQNSGPQVKDGTRERLHDNFYQGVMKIGTVGRKLVVRWVNTVVDLRDLTHRVGRLTEHEDPAETTWTTPEGWLVIRRQAISEATNEPLWPEKYGHAEAEVDKSTDMLSFLKRMQNRCIEPELMTFKQEWFKGNGADLPGCLDYDRVLGEVKPGHVSTQGYDPTGSDKAGADFAGQIVVSFDKTQAEPRTYYVVWIDQFRAQVEEQADKVIAVHGRFNCAKTKVEANAVQQWFLQLKKIKDAMTNTSGTVHGAMKIEPHYTGAGNKPDPDIGLPSLAAIVKTGKCRFPYGDAMSRKMTDKFISQAVLHQPTSGRHSGDLLMAWWFSLLAAREVARVNLLRVVRRPVPAWASGFGMARR
jgi:hypothetical protein